MPEPDEAPCCGPQIEEEEPTGFIRFEKFERMMSRILLENQYPRDSEDKLLRAFRVRGLADHNCSRTLLACVRLCVRVRVRVRVCACLCEHSEVLHARTAPAAHCRRSTLTKRGISRRRSFATCSPRTASASRRSARATSLLLPRSAAAASPTAASPLSALTGRGAHRGGVTGGDR